MKKVPSHRGSIKTTGFWDSFVKNVFNQKPMVFKKFCDPIFASDTQLMEVLQEASQRRRFDSSSVKMRFYRDGATRDVFEDYAPLLPKKNETTLNIYNARLKKALNGRQWGIILNEINAYSPILWEKSRDFVYELFKRIGHPGGHITTDSFMGNYDRTPFGLHKDQFHVFTFPIVGKKKIKLWPFNPMSKLLNLSNDKIYDPLISGIRDVIPQNLKPIVLEAMPGDLIYWPASYWHIAHGNGQVNATVTLGLDLNPLVNQYIAKYAQKPTTRIEPDTSHFSHRLNSKLKHLHVIKLATKEYAKHLNSSVMKNKFMDEYFKKISSFSFTPEIVPDLISKINLDTHLQMDSRFPIYYQKTKRLFHCYVNGHKFSIKNLTIVEKFFKQINLGKHFVVKDLCNQFISWGDHQGYFVDKKIPLDLISSLVKLRALKIIKKK